MLTIADLRRLRGYTQEEVAKAIGVNQSYYSRIEIGKANPTLDKLRRLAVLFDVSVGDLVSTIPPPPKTKGL